jgi:hypothetical protein
VTDAVATAGRHVPDLTAVYAHTLVSACPRPDHAPAYGRMVLEGAIHRTVTEHAVRLHQIARTDALRGEVDITLHHADVLAAVLDDLARRWGTEPRPTVPTQPTAPAPAPAGTATDNERLLIATLTEQPSGTGGSYACSARACTASEIPCSAHSLTRRRMVRSEHPGVEMRS